MQNGNDQHDDGHLYLLQTNMYDPNNDFMLRKKC